MLHFRGAYVSIYIFNIMKNEYKTTSHVKHLLQYHIIFVCKYRCKIFENDRIDTLVKHILNETAENSKCMIYFIESDKDHIHMMIETILNTNLSQLANKLKSRTSYHL